MDFTIGIGKLYPFKEAKAIYFCTNQDLISLFIPLFIAVYCNVSFYYTE
jgi:hypothetical protein